MGVVWKLLPELCDLNCLCSFRYRSPAFHVQAWYDEVKDYTYPYPHECNPWCPEKCTGSMCTHYTQVKETKGFCTSTLFVPHRNACPQRAGLLVFNNRVALADSLGHDEQDRLCRERLQADERLGRNLGECRLPGLQLLAEVRQMSLGSLQLFLKLAACLTSPGSGEEISV